ncbi:MAG: glycosyltransferase family 4 protein [Chlamydiae bacterium]|nr:glycosyltransferase family 4 protein [Chlamydiota bacterium]MBI3266532.1 glycosyltransferase family 4 protein [Chlamydiota bacterium]
MKVLLVSSHLNAGGITSYVLTLAQALGTQGCQVILASGGGQFEKTIAWPHFNLGIHTKFEIGPSVWRGAYRMKKLIENEGISLVHAQTRVAAVTSFLATVGTKIPFLTTAHGFFRPHLGRKIFPCWGKAVIAISTQVREHLQRDFRVKPQKIHLIYNGTDLRKYQSLPSEGEKEKLLSQLKLKKEIPRIGIVARLSPVKGHHFLLGALHELSKERPVRCVVVGDGPTRQEFLSEVERLGLKEIIRWIPWVDDPKAVLNILDVFVLPSLQEGLSLSILEAQASGIPVVASNVGGISEVVIEGQTGLLVPPQNSGALKKALACLLDDPPLASKMGLAGREHVKEQFGLDRMAREVMNLYRNLLDETRMAA